MATYNVTASEVRYAGGWESTDVTDTMLESAGFIPAGDAWLHDIIGGDLDNVSDTEESAMLKAAEIYFVAHLVAKRPPKDNFQAGPLKATSPGANDNKTAAKDLLDTAEEFLGKAGYTMSGYTWSEQGGSDYRESGTDSSNVDIAQTDREDEFRMFGG